MQCGKVLVMSSQHKSILHLPPVFSREESEHYLRMCLERYRSNKAIIEVLSRKPLITLPVRSKEGQKRLEISLEKDYKTDEIEKLLYEQREIAGIIVYINSRNERARSLFSEDGKNKNSKTSPSTQKSLTLAQFLLCMVAGRDEIAPMLGDLDEIYFKEVLPRVGERKANLWYWWQTLRAIWAFLGVKLKRWLCAWIDRVFGTPGR